MKRMTVQGLTLNLSAQADGDTGTASFECEEINDRGEVIETWEIQFELDPNQLRCMSQKGREAERALVNDRELLDVTRGFRILAPDLETPADDDEGI